jgi:hypothetical protein
MDSRIPGSLVAAADLCLLKYHCYCCWRTIRSRCLARYAPCALDAAVHMWPWSRPALLPSFSAVNVYRSITGTSIRFISCAAAALYSRTSLLYRRQLC